jgi:hypothetical protein
VLLLLLLIVGGGGVASLLVVGSGDESAAEARGPETAGSGLSEGSERRSGRRGARERVQAADGSEPASAAESGATDSESGDDEDVEKGAGGDGAGAEGAGSGPETAEDDRVIVRGHVVDAATDRPLAGVRILVCRPGHGWHGARTDENGDFDGRAPPDTGDGTHVEVRVAKRGYHTMTIPWTEGPVAARLERRDGLVRPGAVVGLATDLDGRPLTGRILLTTYDAMDDHHGLWALADESGAFRLEGLYPGWWKLRLVGSDGDFVEAIVPEGGETRVHVVGGATPWPGTMTEDEFLARRKELSRGVPRGRTDDALTDEQREALAWQRIMAMQDLESRWRGIRPARRVEVIGLPRDVTMYVRAKTTNGPNHSWRARVVDGMATFPALTFERWTLLAEFADESQQVVPLVVPEGEGPLQVSWSALER